MLHFVGVHLKPSNTSHHSKILVGHKRERGCTASAWATPICHQDHGSIISKQKKHAHINSLDISMPLVPSGQIKNLVLFFFDFHLLCSHSMLFCFVWFIEKKRASSSVDSPPVVPTPSVVLPVALGSPRSASDLNTAPPQISNDVVFPTKKNVMLESTRGHDELPSQTLRFKGKFLKITMDLYYLIPNKWVIW